MNFSDSRHGFYEEIAIYQLAKMKTYPQVTLEELKIHHENPHIDGYRFQCPSCERNYSREDNLNAHIKKSHNNEPAPNAGTKVATDIKENRERCNVPPVTATIQENKN